MRLTRAARNPSRPNRIPNTSAPQDSAPELPDEEAVIDDRANLRPAQMVEMKLLRLLPARSVPVSCLHSHRLTRR